MAHAARLSRYNKSDIHQRFQENCTAFTIAEFCILNDISISTYYELQKTGEGPRVIDVSASPKRRAPRITAEAIREWMVSREYRPGQSKA